MSDVCVDKRPDCADFTLNACKAPYVNWAHANCPAFCGFCRKYFPQKYILVCTQYIESLISWLEISVFNTFFTKHK